MKYRLLGKTNLKISEIGHGTWAMGSMWGARDDAEALKALRAGIESGINFIDTAYIYGQGHSEQLIAQVLKETPEEVYVATKCPPNIKSWPPKPGTRAEEAFPSKHLIKLTETSLKNLNTDCLDLLQLHVWQDEWLEQGDWQETIAKLKSDGKIRFFGVSLNDHEPDSGLSLVESGLVDSIQVIFNLFDQSPREKLFPLCLKHQVGVIARVPLDEGGLTGKLSTNTEFAKGDWRRRYFTHERLKETCEHAEQFKFLIQAPISTLPQAALKFCLSEEAVSTVIPGMRTTKHVVENTTVSDLPDITPEILEKAHQQAWIRNFYPKYGW